MMCRFTMQTGIVSLLGVLSSRRELGRGERNGRDGLMEDAAELGLSVTASCQYQSLPVPLAVPLAVRIGRVPWAWG